MVTAVDRCPSWCQRAPHRYVGPTLIHESVPVAWGVAEMCGTVTRQWRSYDDGAALLALRVQTEVADVELELTVSEAMESMQQVALALDQQDPRFLAG